MSEELTEKQKNLFHKIKTWIDNGALSVRFTFIIKKDEIYFSPKELQILWPNFEEDINALVKSGFLQKFSDNSYVLLL